MIIFFLILSHHYVLGMRFNLTKLLEEQLEEQYHVAATSQHRDHPTVVNHILYLPEDNRIDDDNKNNIDDERDADDDIGNNQVLGRQLNEKNQLFLRYDRNLMADYQNLCETKTRKVLLNDEEYEYQPPFYNEIYCKNYAFDETQSSWVKASKQQCAHPGFHCVQRSKSLFMVRRRWTDECWEPFSKQIASGCDCMWPVSTLGDISAHY